MKMQGKSLERNKGTTLPISLLTDLTGEYSANV